MQLLVIRHAIAEDRDAFARTGASDDLRPLTAEGRRRMRRVARGLRREVPALARLATSPLLRAQETASIVAAEYRLGEAELADALVPDVPLEGALAWVADAAHEVGEDEVVAIVGHEPHLSSFVTWLLTVQEAPMLELKKGGACLLELPRAPEPGRARLRWVVTAGQLRALGR